MRELSKRSDVTKPRWACPPVTHALRVYRRGPAPLTAAVQKTTQCRTSPGHRLALATSRPHNGLTSRLESNISEQHPCGAFWHNRRMQLLLARRYRPNSKHVAGRSWRGVGQFRSS
jgi:hypothetical protein